MEPATGTEKEGYGWKGGEIYRTWSRELSLGKHVASFTDAKMMRRCLARVMSNFMLLGHVLIIFCLYLAGKTQNFRPGHGFEDEHTEQQQSKHAERGSTYE